MGDNFPREIRIRIPKKEEKDEKAEFPEEIQQKLRFKPLPEEISLAKRQLLNYVLREINQVDAFWRYRYRSIVSSGIGISYEVNTDIGEVDEGLVVAWTLKVLIPKEIWIKMAWLKKNKLFRLPKPHPVIRQKERKGQEKVDEEEKEISEFADKVIMGEIDGEEVGAVNSRSDLQ